MTTPRATSAVQTSPRLNLLITLLCNSLPWTSHSLSKFLCSYRILLFPQLIPFKGALQCLQAYRSDRRFSCFSQSKPPSVLGFLPHPSPFILSLWQGLPSDTSLLYFVLSAQDKIQSLTVAHIALHQWLHLSCMWCFCDPIDYSPSGSVQGFSRQDYWSVLPFLLPGNLPDPAFKPASPALAGRFFTTKPSGKPPWWDVQFLW